MSRVASRIGAALVVALLVNWLLDAIFEAAFLVPVNGPIPPYHVPRWLESFAYTVQLAFDLAPGVVLGAIAVWRPGLVGFIVGLVVRFVSQFLSDDRLSMLASLAMLNSALQDAILWAFGAVFGAWLVGTRTPNKSLERTRVG